MALPVPVPVVGVLPAPRRPRCALVAVAVAVVLPGTSPVTGLSGRAPHRSLARFRGDWPPPPAAQAL
eukprot:28313-Pyramimonas_sp.AAC.1